MFYLIFLFIIFLYLLNKLDVSNFPFLLVKSDWFKNFIYKFYFNYKKIVDIFDYLIKISVFIILPFTINFFFQLLKKLINFFYTKEPVASLVIPGLKTKTFYLPFFEGIIAIFLIAFLHELFHGIIALKNKINIKSAGFGFFLIIPIAFVELDEELLKKINIINAISILLAGSFINLLTGFTGFFILSESNKVLNNYLEKEVVIVGTIKNTSAYGKFEKGEIILEINGIKIKNLIDIYKAINKSKKYVTIKTNKHYYNLTFTKINGKKMIGIYVEEVIKNKNIFIDIILFIQRVLYYFSFLSINLGFVNLFPLFITDGQKIIDLLLYNKPILLTISRILSLFLFLILLISAILGI